MIYLLFSMTIRFINVATFDIMLLCLRNNTFIFLALALHYNEKKKCWISLKYQNASFRFFFWEYILCCEFFFHIIKPHDACLYAKCYSHSQKIHDVCDIYFTAFFVHDNFKISYFNLNFNSVVSGLVLIHIYTKMKIWLW